VIYFFEFDFLKRYQQGKIIRNYLKKTCEWLKCIKNMSSESLVLFGFWENILKKMIHFIYDSYLLFAILTVQSLVKGFVY